MSRASFVPVLKFVGTISVGLLTGVSYATATTSIPSLYALPTAASASPAYNRHVSTTRRQVTILSATSAGAYVLAFLLSPPRGGRHPYLIWTSLVVSIGAGVDWALSRRDAAKALNAKGKGKGTDDDFVNVEQSGILNGEEVRKSLESWRVREMIRGSITGLAFTMGVIGIWGDGFAARRGA